MTRFSSFNLYEDPQPSTSATTDFEVLGATCSNYYDENWESFFSQDGSSVRETASKNETFNLDSDLPRFMNPPSRSARNKQVQGVNERDFTTCDNYYGKNWESFSSQDCSSAWKAASEKETFNPISDLPNLTNPSSSDAGNKGVQGLSERDSLRLQPWGDKLNTFETKLSASQGSASKDHYDDYYKHQSKKDTYNNLEIWPSNSSVKEEMAEGATFSQKKVKFIQDHAEYFNNSNILQAADENKIIQSMVDERFNTHTEYDGNYHKSNADKKEASGNNFTTKDGKKIVRILKPVSGKPCRPIHEVLKQTEGPEQYLFRDKENTADDLNNSSEENGDQSPGIVSIELFDWNTADDSNLIKKRNNEPGTSKQATVIRRSYGQRDRNERKKPFEQLKKFFQWKKAKKFEDTSTGKNWKFLRALRETPYEGHNKSIPLPVFSPESNGSCSQGAECSFRRSKAITFIKKLTKSPKNETDEESLSQDVKNEFNAEALVLEEMKEFPEKETADESFSLAVKNESKNEALIFEPEAWSSFENLYDEG
ncbi:uncharacterized protein [Parasteatoda tepidariorum]|uniref:uncharacterized protein n=1 Tax=Parasteatoda tepidariorum TaxID=114398 RepID=UPI0039BD4BC8